MPSPDNNGFTGKDTILNECEIQALASALAGEAHSPAFSMDNALELERFRFVLDASDDALITKTLDGTITTWNRGAERMFGYAASEAIGQSILMLFPPERIPEEAQIVARLRAGQNIDHFETERLHKSGRRITVHVTVSPMKTSEGEIVGAAKIVRDISVQKEAEAQTNFARTLVDSSDDAILSKTLDGIITSWNPGAERIFGYTADEAIGQPMLMLFPEERRHEEDEILRKIRTGERIRHFESRRVRKDGKHIDVSVTISPIRDENGNIVGASKIARDITERKRLEAQHQLAATLIESSDDAIVSKTLEGIITSWNAGAERVFGYTAEEAIGQPMLMLFPKSKVHEEEDILRQIRQGERIDHFETVRVRKDGRLIHVSVSISPMRDADGEVVGASKIARDITERKQADAQKALSALLIESSDDAIVSKTLDGTITSWNSGAERVFGYTADEAIGQPMLMLFPQYKIDEEAEILRRIRNGERIDHFETLRVRKDRRLIHISATISPMRDESGRIVGASKIARDISDRKQADAQKALAALLIESSDDAIVSKTLDGIITSWNTGAQRIFGYTAEEAIGQPMLMLFPQDKIEEEDYILGQIRAGKRVEHFETIRVRRDRTPIHVSVTISPMRDASGRIVGASKIARDITQRRRAESHMRLASTVFDHTHEAVAIADFGGRILQVNEAFSQITGYQRREVIGRTGEMFATGRQLEMKSAEILQALKTEGYWHGEVQGRRKNGQNYTGLLTISSVPNDDLSVGRYVALMSDVSELRQQREALKRLAHFDALTGLPNRALLQDRLEQGIARCDRDHTELAVLYMDLDGFKAVNDTYGHDAGDEVLRSIAKRVQGILRRTDTLARLGGDEFVAVMPGLSDTDQCIHLITRIIEECGRPVAYKGVELKVSTSVGMTLYPRDNVDGDHLIRHADMAMYEAKRSGKNCYAIHDAITLTSTTGTITDPSVLRG